MADTSVATANARVAGLDPPDPRRWLALAAICAAQFMVVLDIAIVNVALPSIRSDLSFSQESLQWVLTAYSIFFGGFLLLGGRSPTSLGRRRVFMVGLDALHRRLAAVRARLERGLADRVPRDCRASAARCSRRPRSRSSTTTFARGP